MCHVALASEGSLHVPCWTGTLLPPHKVFMSLLRHGCLYIHRAASLKLFNVSGVAFPFCNHFSCFTVTNHIWGCGSVSSCAEGVGSVLALFYPSLKWENGPLRILGGLVHPS